MPREKFGVGDNTAIGVDEVVDALRIGAFTSDRFTKSTALDGIPFFIAPYRIQIISITPIVTIAFQTTALTINCGVPGSASSLGTVTLALDTATGVATALTLGPSPIVIAGQAVTVTLDGTSTGTGAFMLQVNYRKIG